MCGWCVDLTFTDAFHRSGTLQNTFHPLTLFTLFPPRFPDEEPQGTERSSKGPEPCSQGGDSHPSACLWNSLTHHTAKGGGACWPPAWEPPSTEPILTAHPGQAGPYLHRDGDVDLGAEDGHAVVSHTHRQHDSALQGGADGLSVQRPQVSE